MKTVETLAAKTVDSAELRARYDKQCKNLLRQRPFLAFILHCFVAELQSVSIEDIEERLPGHHQLVEASDSVSKDITGGEIDYDLVIHMPLVTQEDKVRMLEIDIEGEGRIHRKQRHAGRMTYYLARMVSDQRGNTFYRGDYEKLRKVVGIWLVFMPSKIYAGEVWRYAYTTSSENGIDVDLFESVVVNVPSIRSESDAEKLVEAAQDEQSLGLAFVGTLFSTQLSPDIKKNLLSTLFNITMTETIERSVEDMGTPAEGLYEEAFEEGYEKAYESIVLTSIQAIRKKYHEDAETAMDVLEVPGEQRPYFREALGV